MNTVEPTVEFKHFRPFFAGREATARPEPGKTRTLGFRALFGYIGAFGEQFQSNSFSFVGGTPLFARFFLGGEETIRGYNIRGIAPTAPVRTIVLHSRRLRNRRTGPPSQGPTRRRRALQTQSRRASSIASRSQTW